MGKKRKRASPIVGDVEIDPLYFDNPIGGVKRPGVQPGVLATETNNNHHNVNHADDIAKVHMERSKNRDREKVLEALHAEERGTEAAPMPKVNEVIEESELESDHEKNPTEFCTKFQKSDIPSNHRRRSETVPTIYDAKSKENKKYGDEDDEDEDLIVISDTTYGSDIHDEQDDNVIELLSSSPISHEEQLGILDGPDVDSVVIVDIEQPVPPSEVTISEPSSRRKKTLRNNDHPTSINPDTPHLSIEPENGLSTGSTEPVNSKPPSKPRAPLQPVEVNVICKISGSEGTKHLKWSSRTPFYSLEKEYGRSSLLLYKGKPFKKYQTPEKLDPLATTLNIEVVDEIQWKKQELRILENSAGDIESSYNGVELEQEPTNATSSNRFPITLDGKFGEVRALVSPSSVISDLVSHYLKTNNAEQSGSIHVKFDGDNVKFTDTIEDIDMEEDDKLDIYV